MPVQGSDPDKVRIVLEEALMNRDLNEQYPFVVFHKSSRKIICSTRFLKLNEAHLNLAIGSTWYVPEYWGQG